MNRAAFDSSAATESGVSLVVGSQPMHEGVGSSALRHGLSQPEAQFLGQLLCLGSGILFLRRRL
jgi:hypothetical protein